MDYERSRLCMLPVILGIGLWTLTGIRILAQSSDRNFKRILTYVDDTSRIEHISYFDALALETQRQVAAGDASVITQMVYDQMGRLTAVTKPVESSALDGFLPIEVLAGSAFNGNNEVSGLLLSTYNDVKPYKAKRFLPDPLNRVAESFNFGADFHQVDRSVRKNYAMDTLSRTHYKIRTVDQDGNVVDTFTDLHGNVTRHIGYVNPHQALISTMKYDFAGNLVQTIPPSGNETLGANISEQVFQINPEQNVIHKLTANGRPQEVRAEGRFLFPDQGPGCAWSVTYRYRTYWDSLNLAINDAGNATSGAREAALGGSGESDPWTHLWKQVTVSGSHMSLFQHNLGLFENVFEIQILQFDAGACHTVPPDLELKLTQSNYDQHGGNQEHASKFIFNTLNMMIQEDSPDEGLVEYVYDDAGNLRFMQTANQRARLDYRGRLSSDHIWQFFKYDDWNRLLGSGEFRVGFTNKTAAELYEVIRVKPPVYNYDTLDISAAFQRKVNESALTQQIMYSLPENTLSALATVMVKENVSTCSVQELRTNMGTMHLLKGEDLPPTEASCCLASYTIKYWHLPGGSAYHDYKNLSGRGPHEIEIDKEAHALVVEVGNLRYAVPDNDVKCETFDIEVDLAVTGRRVEKTKVSDSESGPQFGFASYPTQDITYLTLNHYDDYDFQNPITGDGKISSVPAHPNAMGRLTKSEILDPHRTEFVEEMFVYDRYGRIIQKSVYLPALGSVRTITQDYSKSGQPTATVFSPGTGDAFSTISDYDSWGRLRAVSTQYFIRESQPILNATYAYDNKEGLLTRCQLGLKPNSAPAQGIDYRYTLQGWLKSVNHPSLDIEADPGRDGAPGGTHSLITPDRFGMHLNYYGTGEGNAIDGSKPVYNGNVRSTTCQASGGVLHGYGFRYDGVNRLSSGQYKVKTTAWIPDDSFTEDAISYDANGNIQKLQRSGLDLNYQYETTKVNRLKGISGLLNSTFAHDSNGNIVDDQALGLITYNFSNRPLKIALLDGNRVQFTYDREGRRLERLYLDESGNILQESRLYYYDIQGRLIAEYQHDQLGWHASQYTMRGLDEVGKCQILQYDGDVGVAQVIIENSTLARDTLITASQSITVNGEVSVTGNEIVFEVANEDQPEGAVLRSAFNRQYFLKDHLGSVRAVVDSLGDIVGRQDYYPLGSQFRSGGIKSAFLGKSKDPHTGLSYFGLRFYSAALGRWMTGDPAKEYTSPYAYVRNNPAQFTDDRGAYAVSVHYKITLDVLKASGMGPSQSDLIAHYASIFADHPPISVIVINNFLLNPNVRIRDGISYARTRNSQLNFSKYATWHSMRASGEAISAGQAMMRGLNFGWSKIFNASKKSSLSDLEVNSEAIQDLGQGLHALQDAYAHKGASMTQHFYTHPEYNLNDLYGNTTKAQRITNSAMIVYEILRGSYGGLSDGLTLDLTGMSATHQKRVVDAIRAQGYVIEYKN